MQWRYDRDRIFSFGRFLWRRFNDDNCFGAAGALSYTTLVSLVPLMVAALAIVSAFPAFAEVRASLMNYVFQNFLPAAGEEVQAQLDSFAGNASRLTGISILVMLFSAVSMMVSIEDRLNQVWRVDRPRGWGSRVLLYWAALTLGPVLVVGGVAATSYVIAMPLLRSATAQWNVGAELMRGVPFAVTFVSLFLLYALVPNTTVRKRHAAIGALIGAAIFEFSRWGFALFVRHAPTYGQVYGALAALPIVLLWIYLSWVIVILCASVAAAISAFDYLPAHGRLPEHAAFLGLMVVLKHFVEGQRSGRGLDQATLRMREPCLGRAAITRYLADLHRADLIQRGESGRWLLKRALDSTDLLRVYHHTHYRLPLEPRAEAASLGLDLPLPLLALLDALAEALAGTLGTPLDLAFPPSPHASPRRKESAA